MNTHADKTTNTKSNAVANGMTAQQSAARETFQFEDCRPEAIAQRKIQQAVSNSEQLKQLNAIQAMANNRLPAKQFRRMHAMADMRQEKTAQAPDTRFDVVQRQLEKGKLNIVGEYHSWSDGRRDKEKQFVEQNGLGGYWTEAEFKIAQKGEPDVYADDPALRALQASIELVTKCEALISKESGFKQNKELQPNEIKIVNTYLVEKIGRLLLQILFNAKNAGEQRGTSPVDLDILERIGTSFVENHKTGQIKLKNILLLKEIVQTKLIPHFHPTINTKDKTAYVRSFEMLTNAERSNTPGVWKVGEAHIPDMVLFFDPNTNITLTKEKEFRKNLMEFLVAGVAGRAATIK